MTRESYTDFLLSSFDSAELDDIDRCAITFASGEKCDAVRLAAAWDAHVAKIDSDRSLPWTDRTVWNEFDLVAALTMRDYFERALDALPPALRARMSALSLAVDERFRGFTVADSGERIAAIGGGLDLTGRGWWWFRVPESGPIAEDFARRSAG